MNINKYWYVKIGNLRSGKTLVLSKFLLRFLLIFMFLLISFFLFLTYNFVMNKKIESFNKNLEKENLLLKEKLAWIEKKTDSIEVKIKLIENWEDDFRQKNKFKPIDKDLRKMGIGGIPINNEESILNINNSEIRKEYLDLYNELIYIEAKVDFSFSTHKEVIANYNLRKSIFNNTPSIYPAYGKITDPYGYRFHPILRRMCMHYGVDVANREGTPIYATANGKVSKTSYHYAMGNYIIILHKYGYITCYGHLKSFLVSPGEEVVKGQVIGLMGSTGRSTGHHVHYEVRRYRARLNPENFFNVKKEEINIALE